MDVKQCKQCGLSDRFVNGACKPCWKAARIKCNANIQKTKITSVISKEERSEKKRLINAAWRAKNKKHIRDYNFQYAKKKAQRNNVWKAQL